MPRLPEALGENMLRCTALLDSAAGAVSGEDWASYRAQLTAGCAALERRFAVEERALGAIPEPSGPSGFDPQSLRAGRTALRRQLAELLAADPARDPEGCRRALGTVQAALHQHAAGLAHALGTNSNALPAPLEAELIGELGIAEPGDREPGQTDALDVRGLNPPDPMLRIVEALRAAPSKPLRVRIHREPFPLYGLLDEQGYSWHTEARQDGSFEILIEPPAAAR